MGRGKQWPAPVGVWAVLTHPDKPWTTWSINEMLAVELAAYLDCVRPRRILEAGSGYSTAILAAYAAQSRAEVVTLEHEKTYFQMTMRKLHRLGLDRHVDLRLAPLRQHWFQGRGPYQWYDSPLDGDFDFAVIDGPPKVFGRPGAFFALQGHLRPGWQVWIDDAHRQHENHSVKVWEKAFSGSSSGGAGTSTARASSSSATPTPSTTARTTGRPRTDWGSGSCGAAIRTGGATWNRTLAATSRTPAAWW